MAVRRDKRVVPRADKKTVNFKNKSKNKDNKLLVVAQEIKIAKILAGNDKKSRDKGLRHLKKWLTFRSASTYDFTEQDFTRLWKGLFYCVWMSDKPLVQEELCENISKLFECFGSNKFETSLLFYKCFLSSMAADWFGIDQHRLDKFLMFARRMTRGILRCLKEQKWSTKSLELLNQCLTGSGGILSCDHPKLCLGLQMHLVDCWMEEVAKISEGDISPKAVVALAKPFAQFLSYGEETRLASSITRNVFIYLFRQSDVGMEYQERLQAWKSAGFPGGSVDAMQRVEVEDSEETDDDNVEDETPDHKKQSLSLDPRAGNVDTELPQLPVDGNLFSAMLKKLTTDSKTTRLNREKLKALAQNFETLAAGEYPYKMKNVVLGNDSKFKLPKTQRRALELLDFEEQMKLEYEDEDLKGLNKRQRRKYLMKQRKLLEAEAADESENVENEDNPKLKKNPPPAKKAKRKNGKNDTGVWTVENIKDNASVRPDSSRLSNNTSSPQSKSETILRDNSESNVTPNKSLSLQKKVALKKNISGSDHQDSSVLGNKTSTPRSKSEHVLRNASQNNISLNNSTNLQKKARISVKKISSECVNPDSSILSKNTSTPQTKSEHVLRNGSQNNISLNNSSNSQKKNRISTKKSTSESAQQDSSILSNNISTPQPKIEHVLRNGSQNNTPLNSRTSSQKKVKVSTKKSISESVRKDSSMIINNTSTPQPKSVHILRNASQSNISLNSSSNSQKKVMISLKKNTSQGVMDYFKSVKQSPEIPFDGDRKPLKTSMKPNSLPSPINPFYKKKLKLTF